jgi:hypothetical protein
MGTMNDDKVSQGNPDAGAAGSEKKGARPGQPDEKKRSSQENAGSTEGGGTRNAGNTIERATDDGGAGRDQQAGDRGQVAKDDGSTGEDTESGNDASSQSGQIGNKDRERSGSTRSRS